MTSRGWVLGASLFAGLVLGMGFYMQIDRLRREQRHDLWMSYVRGPLRLYVQGSRAGAALLHADGAALRRPGCFDAAIKALDRSNKQASDEQGYFEADAFFDDLDRAVAWHHAADLGAQPWTNLKPGQRQDLHQARQAAEDLRVKLAKEVSGQWDRGDDDWSLSPSEKMESLATIKALEIPLP